MDVLLLTLINVVACLTFPKLLSVFFNRKSVNSQVSKIDTPTQATKSKITSFPYCTVYALTGSQYCKFSPRFCNQCSPN